MFRKIFSPDWKAAWPESTALAVAICVLSIVLMLPVLYTGLFNHPCPVDDYVNAVWDNFYDAQRYWYLNWTGRYFSGAVLGLNPLHWGGFTGYKICSIALIILFVVSFGMLVYRFLRHCTTAPKSISITIACATVLLLVNSMDSLTQGFYWYAGAMTYTLGGVILTVLLCIFIRPGDKRLQRPATATYVLCAVLIFATIGSNELSMVLCDVICGMLWLYYRSRRTRELSRFYGVLFIICILCSAMSVFAPGNAVREDTIIRDASMFIPNWLSYAQKLLLRWVLDPFVLIYSAFVVFVFSRYTFRTRRINLLAAFAVPVIVILIITFPNVYIMGRETKPRVENFIFFFFVPAWGYFLLVLSTQLQLLLGQAGRAAPALQHIFLVMLSICILISCNTHDLRLSNLFLVVKGLIKGIPQQYDAEQSARYAFLSSTTADSVAVPPLRATRCNVVYLYDIKADPAISYNVVYAKFWKKAAIWLSADSTFHSDN